MKYYWNPLYTELQKDLEIKSIHDFEKITCDENILVRGTVVELFKCTINDTTLYVKKYKSKGSIYRYFGRKSRATKETRSYRRFSAMKIPHAEVVAHGDLRVLGCLKWGIIITKEIPNTVDLYKYFTDHQEQNTSERMEIMKRIAEFTAILHNNKFVHNTHRLRNILFCTAEQKVYLIDCPEGSYRHLPLGRSFVYDLASIYRDISKLCSAEEWTCFFDTYCSHTKANKDKLLPIVDRTYQKKIRK
ncbi:lipopolysaccharide kinase InaA family protein [Candidatus Uabimicrobium amorphum]|uniref:Protein kinase domain-containing protein n=1 Tax=Uabimicrobium amorphum TaxID=2596890 RepID=A0A5S9F2N7_UABAM|nr:lipopolysaccharide kinase InaA family protein [Candidatus Uabimicrobium amorphum]BBM83796.1 hypothetical protein UABAM_02151 [Candidatus Uabimicrobium amorphum]